MLRERERVGLIVRARALDLVLLVRHGHDHAQAAATRQGVGEHRGPRSAPEPSSPRRGRRLAEQPLDAALDLAAQIAQRSPDASAAAANYTGAALVAALDDNTALACRGPSPAPLSITFTSPPYSSNACTLGTL